MYTNYKMNCVNRSLKRKPKMNDHAIYYTITQISKTGYEIVTYEHLSQVLDYFKFAVYKLNTVKLRINK